MRTKRLIALAVACVAAMSVAIAAPAWAAKNAVMAWGQNTEGQLCTGTEGDGFAVGEARGLGEVLGLSIGSSHTLALLPNGTVMACGGNGVGQLGANTTETCEGPCSRVPVQVPAFTEKGEVKAVSAGYSHSLALKGGTVYSWGGNSYGQLGRSSTEKCGAGASPCSKTPEPVKGLPETEKVIAISAGGQQSLALMENHKVMAWGDNEVGQLGNGMTEKSNEHPTPLVGENGQPLENVEAISASGLGGIALLKGGTVATWGSDQYGALGVGAFESNPSEFCPKGPPCSRKALGVKTLPAVSAVSAIGGTDEVLLPNETVMDWGYNGWGNLGDGTSAQDEHGQLSSDVPVPVCTVSEAIPCKPEHQLHGVVGIAEQQYDSMALLASGNVMMWGANTHGQLGVGNAIRYEDVAIPVPGLSEVTSIAGGGHSGMAIQSRPGPRFYSNGILLGASPHATLSSGTITLENATFGKITCRALANGVVDNELERGRGKVESFLALPCTSVPSCPGVFATAERPLELGETEKGTEKVKVPRRGPSSLPWSGEMFTSAETEKTRRLKLERVGLTLVMPCIGGEVFFQGTLEPQLVNGSKNGLKPSHLEFGGAAAGQLVSSTGEGLSLSGTPNPVKLAGEMFELTTAE